ncbi:MAG: hypothetical protein QXV22_04060 [Thermoplasmataceae archaeon]
MSLEDILKSVEAKAQQEIENLTRYYDTKRKELIEAHERLLSTMRASYSKQAEEASRTLELSVVSSAQMESLKIIRTRQEALLQDYLERAEEIISGYRHTERYPRLMDRLVKIAKGALGDDCTIYAAGEDLHVFKPGDNAKKSDDEKLSKYGGIIASSKDGTLELDLSLWDIFSGIREKLISRVLEKLGE